MLNKEQFLKNLLAIKEEDAKARRLDRALEEFNSSWCVLNTLPCEKRLLELTKEMMDDKEDWIDWYLYEDVQKIASTKHGIYTFKNDEDLYYFLQAICHIEDDGASYIAEQLEPMNLFEEKGMALYMKICKETKEIIESFKDKPELANIVVELEYLEDEIKKDN